MLGVFDGHKRGGYIGGCTDDEGGVLFGDDGFSETTRTTEIVVRRLLFA